MNPSWIRTLSLSILGTIGAGFILGGVAIYANTESRAEAQGKREELKQEIASKWDSDKGFITRELDQIHQGMERIEKKLDKILEEEGKK